MSNYDIYKKYTNDSSVTFSIKRLTIPNDIGRYIRKSHHRNGTVMRQPIFERRY